MIIGSLLDTDYKICSKCGIEKELFEFYLEKLGKDGFRGDCKECVKKYKAKHYQKYKKRINKQKKRYKDKNKNKYKKYHNEYNKKRRKKDIKFKLCCYLRSRLNLALKGNTKSLSTMMLIGCEIDYLIYHIQNQFKRSMNWNNYGSYWEIDHIKPCAKFDLSKKSEQLKCFNYMNLQSLTKFENKKKGKS